MKDKTRIGKQVNSIFASTTKKEIEPKEAASSEKHADMPVHATRKTIKSTVTLYVDQVAWLDRLSADILCSTSTVVDRGSIVRGLLTALQESKIDLISARSEEEIAGLLNKQLK